MKNLLAIVLLILVNINGVTAQDLSVLNNLKAIDAGTDCNGKSIKATSLQIEDLKVNYYRYDPDTKLMYVQFVKARRRSIKFDVFVCYNVKEAKVEWSYIKRPHAHSFMLQNSLLFNTGVGSVAINPRTEDEIWTNEKMLAYAGEYIIHANPERNIFLTSKGRAVDASTGKMLWDVPINLTYAGSIQRKKGDTIFMIAEGLKAIDLSTGANWYQELETGVDSYEGMDFVNGFGVASVILFGGGSFQSSPDRVKGMRSQLFSDESGNYLSGTKEIMCVTDNGSLKWKKPLPVPLTGSSWITADDTAIYIINKGYGILGGRLVKADIPYLAAYDKSTGKQLMVVDLKAGDRNVVSAAHKDGYYYVSYDDELLCIDLSSHSIISSTRNNIEGYSVYVPSIILYMRDGDEYSSLAMDCPQCVVMIKDSTIGVFDKELRRKKTIEYSSIYLKKEYSGQPYRTYLSKKDAYLYIDDKRLIKLNSFAAPDIIDGTTAISVSEDQVLIFSIPQ